MKQTRFGATSFFTVIVAVLVAFTAYDYWSSEKNEQKKDDESKVIQLKREDATQIEVTGGNETRSFVKKENLWAITQPIQEMADQPSVLGYLDSIFSEKVTETVKEDHGKGDFHLETYGLDHPLFNLKVRANTATQDLKIGSVKSFDGSLYGQINDQKKVILLSSAWDTILSKPVKEFRDKRLYRGQPSAVFETIVVDGHDSQGPVHFEIDRVRGKEKASDGWLLRSAKPTDQVSTENINLWIDQIKSLRGSEFATTAPGTPPFKADITMTLSRKEAEPFVIKFSRDKKNFDLFEASSSDLPQKFAAHVALAKEAAAGVLLRPEAFFNRKAPFAFEAKKITRVIFKDSRSGKTFDSLVDPAKPDVMIEKLQNLEAVRFLGAQPEKKFPSSLRLLSSEGGLVFEMSWGDPVIETATPDRPEARYLPVRTNLSKQVIGVAEKSIEALSLKPKGK